MNTLLGYSRGRNELVMRIHLVKLVRLECAVTTWCSCHDEAKFP